jgi:hypothetical protein
VANQLRSDEVLPTGSVADVHKETRTERFFRTSAPFFHNLMSFLFLGGLSIVSVVIVFSHDEMLKDLRTPAWAFLAGVGGACLTRLYGGDKGS